MIAPTPPSRLRRAALLVAGLWLAWLPAGSADASIALQRLVGTVSSVSPPASTAFSFGDVVLLEIEVERASVPTGTATHATYLDAVVGLELTVGTHSARMSSGAPSRLDVLNDEFFQVSTSHFYWVDEYRIRVDQLEGSPVDPVALRLLEVSISDAGTLGPSLLFSDTSIPVYLGGTSRIGWVSFTDPELGAGGLEILFTSGVTPAVPATWGRLKAQYAR